MNARRILKAIAKAVECRKKRNDTVKKSNIVDAKYKSLAAEEIARRRARKAMRKARKAKHGETTAVKRRNAKATAVKRRIGKVSRHIPVNCCGRRNQDCVCFQRNRGLEIANSFQKKVFQPIPAKIQESDIQTWRDTGDMIAYERQITWTSGTRYSWLFPIAFMWRHFSNEQFWKCLQQIGAVRRNSVPNFDLVETAMREFEKNNVSYHGGVFYSGSVLTHYRFCSAAKPATKWQKCCKKQDFIAREILALKIMWQVARTFKTQYVTLQRQPTRQCWKACTQDFLSALRAHTKGIFGDYSLKIALDGILLSQPSLEKVVSWWPMGCPAYREMLPALYPETRKTQDDLFLAGCYFHRLLKVTFPKSFLRDSLAQTCWTERKVTR
jgi:hypothetical protein